MSDLLLSTPPAPAGATAEPGCAPGPSGGLMPARPSLPRRLRETFASALEYLLGAVALGLGLAILSATPVVQLASFGYLLESAGRVARTGRVRSAFIGVRRAARVGSMALGCTLLWLPLQLVASWASSARLVDPGGPSARRWGAALAILTALAVVHAAASCARGGRLRYFLWPPGTPGWVVRRLGRGGIYRSARDEVWQFVSALRFPYYFRLGLLGFAGTMAWLVVPVTLIGLGRRLPPLGLLGGLVLGLVAPVLPFLQVRFAAENRFRALFEYRAVRDRFGRAPWAFALAALITLAFALPLYLLKIEMIPRETAWLPSLVFLAFIVPARTLSAWAYARAGRRDRPRHGFFRATARLGMLPIGLFYALIVFFTQFTAWRGIWSLYEQHAFLLPVPFLNL